MGGDGDFSTRLRVTLLGAFQACRGDTVLPIPGPRLRGLLVRLALAGGRPVDAAVLVDALWPDQRPADPANALQSLVSRLRRMLGAAESVAQVEGGGYRLEVAAGDVDAVRFERLATDGRERLRAGDPRSAAALLGEAVAFWSGHTGAEPAAIVAVAPAVAVRLARSSVEADADLAEAELALGRAAAAAARLTALLAEHPVHERAAALLMDALAAQGRQAEALALYERVREALADSLGADPGTGLRERHLRLLRRPNLPAGERGVPAGERGVPAGDRGTRAGEHGIPAGEHPTRAGEHGIPAGEHPTRAGERGIPAGERGTRAVEPGSRAVESGTVAGERGVLGGEPDAVGGERGVLGGERGVLGGERGASSITSGGAPAVGPAGATVPDPGRGGGPAGRDEVPPPSNLPASLTSFIGRDDDLARVDVLLAAGRLVTVTGPGGAGKTRLALEAARRRRHEYRDGAWLVDLSSVTEPAKVGAAVLAAIGLRGAALFEGSGRMRGDGGELDVLTSQLNGRESLLVVDNCEHLIDSVAHLTAALLPRCAGLRVLATSREPLAVDGEALVPLGPLALPDPRAGVEQARRTASVRLFTERAAAVRPGFDVDEETLGEVLRVVRGLDGLPLALELAAARLRTLSLPALAAGLSDRFRLLTTGNRTAFPRHRTLRAVIAWSWDLLGEHERTVAERVSVLPGGVTPASATAVCAGAAVPAAEVPELLAGLVDRSLLQLAPEPGRYRMLETLREYGIDRLTEQGTLGAARGLAAGHLAELVARHDPLLRGHSQLSALRVMRAEYDNALAALRHLCDCGDAAGAVELAMNLAWFWQMLGRHADATFWLGEALALPAEQHTPERDCAEAVLLLNRVGNEPAAVLDAIEGRDAERGALADRLLAHESLPGLAGVLAAVTLFLQHEVDASLAVLRRVIEGPDVWLSGLARLLRAQLAENEGDLDQVRVDVVAALDCFGRTGDRWGLATVLPVRALLRQYDGDLDGALADLRSARALAGEFGSLSVSDEIFIDLRWVDLHLRRDDVDQAIAAIAATRERALRSASPEMIILVDTMEAGMWLNIGDLVQAQELIERAEAQLTVTFPFSGDHGRALINAVRASLCVRQGDPGGAEAALVRAYAAAVESRDMPVRAMVAVTAASLTELCGSHRDTAYLLGAAARLRGIHDPTDLQVRELSRRGREALGEAGFAEAYEMGWRLDGKTALAQTDPARLRRAALPAAGSAAPGELDRPVQARRA